MSRPGAPLDRRRPTREALQLPCGHEVALGGPALLIELSAAILAHQKGCTSEPFGPGRYPEPGGFPPPDPIGRLR